MMQAAVRASPQAPGPLILALTLDAATQTFLTELRAKYFPPARNHLQAHVTLFHAIPPSRREEVEQGLTSYCGRTKPWDVFVGDPRKMGKGGVMVTVRDRPSGRTEAVQGDLLDRLKRGVRSKEDDLTDQDSRPMGKPHVTVLNKAESEEQVETCLKEVKERSEELKQPGQRFGQKQGRATGIELFEYMQGGSWKPLRAWDFGG